MSALSFLVDISSSDDYVDSKYCPEVGPTVDRMRDMGMFKNYYDIGSVPNYENSYLLLKSAA